MFTRLVFEKREALKASLFESHPKGSLEASCSVDAQQQKEVCDSGQTILIEVSCAPFGAPKFGQDLKQIAYGDGPIAVHISCAVNETAPSSTTALGLKFSALGLVQPDSPKDSTNEPKTSSD